MTILHFHLIHVISSSLGHSDTEILILTDASVTFPRYQEPKKIT